MLLDLSHPLQNGQPSFPGDPSLHIEAHATVATHQFNVSKIAMGSHQGTHLDAPFHFLDDGKTLDAMPLSWFYGETRVLRLPKNKGEEITLEDLLPHQKYFVSDAKIILHTGWARYFGAPEFFDGFPSISQEAARFIASKKIRLLGMDMPTPSKDWLEVHHILLHEEIVIVESLNNLQEVPDTFTLMAFPLNFAGRDGSPIRAVALVE